MKQLIIILILLASTAFAQFQDSTVATIDSLGTNTVAVDLNGDRFISITFPAAMTSDTLFIQTASDTVNGGTFRDVYYTKSDGSQVRCGILVQAGKTVGIPVLWAELFKRYVRGTGDAEADDRTPYFNHKR